MGRGSIRPRNSGGHPFSFYRVTGCRAGVMSMGSETASALAGAVISIAASSRGVGIIVGSRALKGARGEMDLSSVGLAGETGQPPGGEEVGGWRQVCVWRGDVSACLLMRAPLMRSRAPPERCDGVPVS